MDYLQYSKDTTTGELSTVSVLNLIINGLPSILGDMDIVKRSNDWVLNLIINGLPSIPKY